jgi:DNA-binding Lrp family transcriptional regulator
MAVRAYILIETDVGAARSVAAQVLAMNRDHATVRSVDTVTGPYDVVAYVEADDLDSLGDVLSEGIQAVQGVKRTTTCLAVRL